MTTTSYLIAWFIYLGGSYGFCVLSRKISHNWKSPFVRNWTRYALVVFLFTPYFSDAAQNRLAPALLITLFESAFGDQSIALSAATPLVLLLILATILAFVLALRDKKTTPVQTPVLITGIVMLIIAISNLAPENTRANEPVVKKTVQTTGFTPPELAAGTFVCTANWNQVCNEEKTIAVPEGYMLCQHHVSVSHQSGNSAYEVTKVEKKGITLKFYAKGNQDRFKQQNADITLQVSLLGVREGHDCFKKPEPKIITIEKKLPPPPPIVMPTPEPKPVPVEVEKTVELPKVHACACSQWNERVAVETCLRQGIGPRRKDCSTYNVKIECVSTKETCQLIHRKSCEAAIGIDPGQSFKRLFIPDSPYCSKDPLTAP